MGSVGRRSLFCSICCFVVLIASAAVDLPARDADDRGSVLVLGSGGLIGSALTTWLNARGYQVHHVTNRTHIDLRIPGALDQFSGKGIQFAFFLACEVGGSKFIDNPGKNVQLSIIEHNVKMYQVVFDWLDRERIPFLFTSSYLQTEPTAYGTVKRMGESWIKSMGKGKAVRLWNIYGHERIGLRSHVLTDWVSKSLQNKHVHCITDGQESRQLLHVDDCANALGIAMENYDKLQPATDISSEIWTTLRELGSLVQNLAPEPCTVTFTEQPAVVREGLEPNTQTYFHTQWKHTIALESGIKRLFREFQADLDAGATLIQPAPSTSHAAVASVSGEAQPAQEPSRTVEVEIPSHL